MNPSSDINRPAGIRPKRILIIGPNTKESVFDSRWVTAHQGSHWWASRMNTHGHYAATYDMNLQPGEIADDTDHPHVSLEEFFKRGMPGFYNHILYSRKLNWEPYTDILDLFTIQKKSIDDMTIVWQPWDIIGFSILDATIEYDLAKIITAKKLAPNALLIGGGSQATLNYQTLFDKSPLDMVILGQEPFAMLNIANEKTINLFEPKAATGIVMRNNAYVMTSEIWKEWIDELDLKAMHQDLYWKKTACLYDNPQFQDINTFRLFVHNFCPVNCAYCTLTGLQKAATGKPTKAVGLGGLDIVHLIKRVMAKYPETHQVFFCFPPDTDIWIPSYSWKKIKDIEVGDSVISAKNEFRKVKKIYKHRFDGDLVKLKIYHGNSIMCTPNHKILIRRKKKKFFFKPDWIEAEKIKSGDHIWAVTQKRWYKVNKIEMEKYHGDVYNLSVEKDHNYCANGYAVSNCDDDFFLTPDWEKSFNLAMIKAKEDEEIPENLGFICLTNINRLDDDAVGRCAKAGFRVLSIGVESVSQWKLNSMNKPQTPARIWKVTESILRHGIKPYYTLLIHTPYERPEDMVVDINGFRKMAKIGVGLSIEPYLMPLHGTIFHEADVPTRYKVIPIEGSRESIKKGTAWIPARKDSLEIFLKFEEYFPRFKKWKYDNEKEIRHREKNFYSHVILDAQEFVLRHFFPEVLSELSAKGIKIETPSFPDNYDLAQLRRMLEDMGNYDVDSVGSVIKRKSVMNMNEVDFSYGRVDVRELQRKMAIESEDAERISSVDSSEQLKEKAKKEKNVEGSFH